MEPNCNSVFLLGWKTPCPLWRKMLAGLWLVSHPLSSLSGDGSLTDFTPKSALPVQGCDYTLNSQNGPASLSPRLGWLLAASLQWELVRLPALLLLPWSFSPDLAHQGGLAACSWPGRRWAVSHGCCSTATGRLQLRDREAPGIESPLRRGSLGKGQSASPGGVGWGGCSGAAAAA